MTFSQKTALVLGATGQQGGAVTKALQASGWNIRALVRDQRKSSAQQLQQQGIELIDGDLDSPPSLVTAMRGVDGVFSVQPMFEKEESRGKAVVDAALATSVPHLVYTSASGADRPVGVASFAAKGEIERYIRTLRVPATILRPVMFMESYRFLAQSVNGTISLARVASPETRTQLIAAQDIGVFAAIAFNDPTRYCGETLEIASDELSFAEIAEIFQRRFARPVGYWDEDRYLGDLKKVTAFFTHDGYKANIASLRQIHSGLLSFEDWLAQENLAL